MLIACYPMLVGKQFWVEAVMYACHLINSLLSVVIGDKNPLEVWSRKPTVDYDFLHVFSTTVCYHVKESKLDPKANKVMGSTSRVKGYHLWCSTIGRIILSKDVTFDGFSILRKVTKGKKKTNTSS